MNDRSADTSIDLGNGVSQDLAGFIKSVATCAVFAAKLATAGTAGARRCFIETTAATQLREADVGSSTQFREISPDVRVNLHALWDAAREDVIEDGMRNSISERLPELIAKDFRAVLPVLISTIESRQLEPVIAAEVLKELGRYRDSASLPHRRWALARALSVPSPVIRDGAGLGLARLCDPASLPYLRRAVEREVDPQIRVDLQQVMDEIAETVTDGPLVANDLKG